MIQLFIGRHGEASFDAPSDRQRSLTENGMNSTRSLIQNCAQQLNTIHTLWSSELVRAQQTAAIYADILGLDVTRQRFLAPESDSATVIRKLSALEGDSAIAIVSHQPLVGELVSLICHGHPYEAHPFVPSELVHIECEVVGLGLGQLKQHWRPA